MYVYMSCHSSFVYSKGDKVGGEPILISTRNISIRIHLVCVFRSLTNSLPNYNDESDKIVILPANTDGSSTDSRRIL